MQVRYRKVRAQDYRQYQVIARGVETRYQNTVVGQVRMIEDRNNPHVPYVWEYKTDNADWTHVSRRANTRTEATNALLDYHGLPRQSGPARATGPRSSSGVRSRGRIFGVEMEITGPGASIIEDALVAAGINVNNHGRYRHTTGAGTAWEIKHDGSVNGHGIEIASPKLSGASGFAQLETVCRVLKEIGATVDRSCGLHVHHNFRGKTMEQIKSSVLAFVDHQDLISQLVAPSRRGSHTYCPTWSSSQRSNLAAYNNDVTLNQISYIGPRGNINLQSYARWGSVEVRLHGGSTNYRKIAAWIRFGQAMFAAAEAGVNIPNDTATNMLGALRNHGLTVEDSATLLRFLHLGETRTAIEASILEAQELLQEVS